jgi:uncharacterized protein (DUF362 family)
MANGTTRVYIEPVENIFLYDTIKKKMYDILGQMRESITLPAQAKVMIKLNLCLLKGHETGATVDPQVARAIVEWLLEHYDIQKIYLAEADATHLGADMAFQILGWSNLFKDIPKVVLLNLSNDEAVPVPSMYIKQLKMPKTMMDANFLISLAKLKTHTQQKITCIMKNQFGAIPYKYKVIYHPMLAQAIYDATAARVPDLSIVDGLIAMEGNGPTNGIPRRTKLLLASKDAIAMDHCCARIMGFRPMSISSLRLAAKHKLGDINYEIIGNPPNPLNLKFKFLPKWKEILKKGMGLVKRGLINEEA